MCAPSREARNKPAVIRPPDPRNISTPMPHDPAMEGRAPKTHGNPAGREGVAVNSPGTEGGRHRFSAGGGEDDASGGAAVWERRNEGPRVDV